MSGTLDSDCGIASAASSIGLHVASSSRTRSAEAIIADGTGGRRMMGCGRITLARSPRSGIVVHRLSLIRYGPGRAQTQILDLDDAPCPIGFHAPAILQEHLAAIAVKANFDDVMKAEAGGGGPLQTARAPEARGARPRNAELRAR